MLGQCWNGWSALRYAIQGKPARTWGQGVRLTSFSKEVRSMGCVLYLQSANFYIWAADLLSIRLSVVENIRRDWRRPTFELESTKSMATFVTLFFVKRFYSKLFTQLLVQMQDKCQIMFQDYNTLMSNVYNSSLLPIKLPYSILQNRYIHNEVVISSPPTKHKRLKMSFSQ